MTVVPVLTDALLAGETGVEELPTGIDDVIVDL